MLKNSFLLNLIIIIYTSNAHKSSINMNFAHIFWGCMKDRFKQIRKALNLSQTEMGELLGKGLRAIQHYEKGERSIDNTVIILLEKAYNVNSNWLITGTGSMFLEEKKDDSKYQWLINTLDKLSEEEVKQIELEAQKILEKQNNKEVNINPTKRIG